MRAALAQGESLFTLGLEDGCALIMARYRQALALFAIPAPNLCEHAYAPRAYP